MKARDVMTRDVVSIGPDAEVLDAARLMLDHKISGLPVVDTAGNVVGIVTEGDFLRRGEIGTQRKRPRWLEFLVGPGRLAIEYVRTSGRKVSEIMTPFPHTVAEDAALEAIVLGLPGIAVSQQSSLRELDFRVGSAFEFEVAASFTARLVAELETTPLPVGTLLNINVPSPPPAGVEVARLGKRVYRDELALVDEGAGGRRQYRIYGDASYERHETGTDLAAVAQGKIAVTPVHFDLTDRDGLSVLERYDLERLVAPAANEVGARGQSVPGRGPAREATEP